tara:strand:- start:401 stop:754 length:354 start_codon:yes stop_codon:yes gene_type:complete
MSIYEYQTFKVGNLAEANFISKKHKKERINLLHKYESIIWQGPHYIKVINEKLKKKKINYIAEPRDDLGLIISLINFKIKKIAISKKIRNKTLKKILSIAENEEIQIFFVENFNFEE